MAGVRPYIGRIVSAAAMAAATLAAMTGGVATASAEGGGPGKPPGPAPAHVQAPAADAPATTIPVPLYHQQHTLSCEESSLSMVLAYEGAPPASTSDAGQRAREDEILGYIGVDTAHWWAGPGSTETADRRAVAGDPFAAYVGNVDGSERLGVQTGYGTYYPTIAKAAQHFGAPVMDAGDGITPAQVYAALREGRPAIVWLTYDLQPHGRDDYVAADGRTIPYAGPWEHTMVVTGIDDTGVRVNDPDRDQYWIPFAEFEAAYAVYGDMAIVFDRAPGSLIPPAGAPSRP